MDFSKLTTYGRTYVSNDLLHFNFSHSGFGFSFIGSKLTLTLISKFEGDSYPVITIYKDSIRTDVVIDELTKEVEVTFSTLDYHEVRVYKRTESSVSSIALKMISEQNYKPLVESHCLKLEFYGDSLTCGYGNLGTSKDLTFKTIQESVIDGYVGLTAKSLNALVSVVAVSGYPFYHGIWNMSEPVESVCDLVSKADYIPKMPLENLPNWDNSKYIPDYVIVNLGANDDGWFNYDAPWIKSEMSFNEILALMAVEHNNLKKRIKAFLNDLFSKYPNTKIIFATEFVPLHFAVRKAILEVIEEYKNNNIYLLKFDMSSCNEMGANHHPGYKMHELASKQLVEFINKLR